MEAFQDEVRKQKEMLEFVCVVCRSAVGGFQAARRTFEKDQGSQKLKVEAAAKKQAQLAVAKKHQKEQQEDRRW